MPDFRVISWNSTGENPAKAAFLGGRAPAIAALFPAHPTVDCVLIQEAVNGVGGHIRGALNGIGWTVQHLPEQMGGGGAAYLCATAPHIVVTSPLALWNFATDVVWAGSPLTGFVPPWHLNLPAVNGARPPAWTTLNVGGDDVLLVTWHAPFGITGLPVFGMPGGAFLDSFIALDHSGLLGPVGSLATLNDITIVAGDLNTTAAGLATDYFNSPGLGPLGPAPWDTYVPLDPYIGWSTHLDHILCWRPAGFCAVADYGNWAAPGGPHNCITGRVTW